MRCACVEKWAALTCAAAVAALVGCRAPEAAPSYLGPPIFFEIETAGEGGRVMKEVEKYARFFGCPTVGKDLARYTLSGRIAVTEVDPVKLAGQVVEHQVRVDAELSLLETATEAVLDSFELDDHRLGAAEKERALRRAVRSGARRIAEDLFYESKILGQPDVRNLVADLVIERVDDVVYNDIVRKLVEAGDRAIPYLMWRLEDRRLVELPGDLPGLAEEEADSVRVCHVANYALEQITGLRTALTTESSPEYLSRVLIGWQRVWRERCGAYREGEELTRLLREKAKAPPAGSEPEGTR